MSDQNMRVSKKKKKMQDIWQLVNEFNHSTVK